MKNLLILAIFIFSISSCNQITGNGNIVTEKRKTGDFKAISVGSAFEVELKSGPVTEVVVEADDNIIKYIDTRVSGDELNIETRNDFGINNGHMKIYITAPQIHSIKCSGAADVQVQDVLKNDSKISIEVSGAGKVKAQVDAPSVASEATGAGTIELSGRTKDYTAKASGSGNIKSEQLKSENTVAEADGAGSVHVHASVSLKADASGAGNVYYTGGATVEKSVSGAGTVKSDE